MVHVFYFWRSQVQKSLIIYDGFHLILALTYLSKELNI